MIGDTVIIEDTGLAPGKRELLSEAFKEKGVEVIFTSPGDLDPIPDLLDRGRILVIAQEAAALARSALGVAKEYDRNVRDEELRELTKRMSDELPARVGSDTYGTFNARASRRRSKRQGAFKSRARL